MPVTVTLAGRVTIRSGDTLLDEGRLAGRQSRVVLAYLAADPGRPVPKDELADALWGDDLPRAWQTAIRMAVSRVRSALTRAGLAGGELLTSAFGCYTLALPEGSLVDIRHAVDLMEEAEGASSGGDHERAAALATEAASVATEPFLAGDDGEWIDRTRARLRDVAVRAFEVTSEACLAVGNGKRAVEAAERVLALEPFRESAHRAVIAGHAMSHNVAEALRAYERCRTLLETELGADPSPETAALHARLLDGTAVDVPEPALSDTATHLRLRVTDATPQDESVLRTAVWAFAGSFVQPAADALVASFGSPEAACAAAVRIRRTLDRTGRGSALEAVLGRVDAAIAEPGTILAGAELNGRCGVFDTRLHPHDKDTLVLRWDYARHVPPAPPRSGPPIVGREDELALLRRCVEKASGGTRQLAVVSGDGGIGKTRIVAEVEARERREGAIVLTGHCREGWTDAYGPFAEALRAYAVACAPDELRVLAAGREDELAVVVPDVAARLDTPRSGRELGREQVFSAVASFLAELSRDKPVLLVLEDLHWADAATIALLGHVARDTEPARIAIVVTYRESDVADGAGLEDALADLRREVPFERVRLAGLDAPGIAALLDGALGAGELSPKVYERTAGNPFFALELARHLADPQSVEGGVPSSVNDVVRGRMRKLGANCRRALTSAAVIGAEFELEVLEEILRLAPDDLVEALEEAVDARILEEAPDTAGRYAFSHDIVRQTLYDGMSVTRRTRLHARAGEALEALRSLDEPPADLAWHFREGAIPAKAASYARRAGNRALEALAFEEALVHFERALASLDAAPDDELRCEVLAALAEARGRSADRQGARDAARDALVLALELRSPDLLRTAVTAFMPLPITVGGLDREVVDALEHALVIAEDDVSVLRVLVLMRLAEEVYWADPERARTLSADAIDAARRVGHPRALGTALMVRHFVLGNVGEIAERLSITAEALELADGDQDEESARTWRLVALLQAGDIRGVDEQMSAISAISERATIPNVRFVRSLRTMRALLAGRLDEAETLVAESLEAVRLEADTIEPVAAPVQLFKLRLDQGRLSEIEPLARLFADRNPRVPAYRCLVALTLAELGRFEEAGAAFEDLATDDFAALPSDSLWLPSVVVLADTCVLLRDVATADVLYRLLLPYAGRNVVIGVAYACLGAADRALGALAALAGRRDDALVHLEDALRLNEELGAGPATASTLYELARLDANGGDAQRSRARAQQVVRDSERFGMAALAERAAELV